MSSDITFASKSIRAFKISEPILPDPPKTKAVLPSILNIFFTSKLNEFAWILVESSSTSLTSANCSFLK